MSNVLWKAGAKAPENLGTTTHLPKLYKFCAQASGTFAQFIPSLFAIFSPIKTIILQITRPLNHTINRPNNKYNYLNKLFFIIQ